MNRFLLISILFLSVSAATLLSSCAPTPKAFGPLSASNTNNRNALRILRSTPTYANLTNKPWPAIHVANLPLKPGMSSPEVPMIRQRLVWLGDLNPETVATGDVYDATTVQAIRQFQWRHGLKSDGEIGESTLRNLNVTPQQRLAQLRINMHRWQKFPDHVGSHYILVNSADFKLNVIKDGNRVMDMRVIVGKSERPTPELYSKVSTIVFNPKWNVPEKIMNEDIIPKVIANPNYLAQENIKIYNNWAKDAYEIKPHSINWQRAQETGLPYRMTQVPGDQNALGRVKFVFMNEHDVYMHDTPQKGLFNEIRRDYSSGCIRVEEPFRLVEYFLKDDPQETQEKVNEYLSTGNIKYVSIRDPIPIYVTYITAWVDDRGLIHFREDIYQRDGLGGTPLHSELSFKPKFRDFPYPSLRTTRAGAESYSLRRMHFFSNNRS